VDPKVRLISAAPYRDRAVHHALVRVIEPVFERSFIDDSYACREGKGNHAAMIRAHRFLRASRYVLKCEGTPWLVGVVIDGSNSRERVEAYFPGDDPFSPFERRRGLPIGNLTSQFFANVYLDGFDHYVKEDLRCRR
jgi:retron-type reverse transcriptase